MRELTYTPSLGMYRTITSKYPLVVCGDMRLVLISHLVTHDSKAVQEE